MITAVGGYCGYDITNSLIKESIIFKPEYGIPYVLFVAIKPVLL